MNHGIVRLLLAIITTVTVWAVGVSITAVGRAQAQTEEPDETPTATEDPGIVEITAPAAGETVSGLVQIVGTAFHPEFQAFVVEYSVEPPVGDDPWTPIQAPVSQTVRGGVLAIWDTSAVPDDRYVIRLRVERTGEEAPPLTVEVNVVVSNATATPLPTLPPQPTVQAAPPTITPGPSPTPLIAQPPTRTPRPTATPGGETPTPPPVTLADSPLAPSRLRQAACQGAAITMVVFVAIAVYGMLRSGVRRDLRILIYNIREFFRGGKRR